MIEESALRFFASDLGAPLFAIPQAADDPNHPHFQAVQRALGSIDQISVDDMKLNPSFAFLHRDVPPAEYERKARIYVLIEYLNHEIPRRRCSELAAQDSCPRPAPYNHPSLIDLELDSDRLVALSEFNIVGGVLLRNEFASTVTPPVQSVNAAYWLLQILKRPALYQSARVRLDPFLFRPAKEVGHIGYRMWIYGVPLQWDRIAELKEEEHGRWFPDPWPQTDIEFTDFVWSPRGEEVHFLCEEVPRRDAVEFRGSRYFHAVLTRASRTFSHVDGAVRLYSQDDWGDRVQTHVRRAGKSGRRIKVFQINAEITSQLVCDLCPSFFVWNMDVARYFGSGPDRPAPWNTGNSAQRVA
ncbi:MAG: hypothetical protein V1694_01505 [Candidatus Eisenbacteria bacterium]